MCVTVCEPVSKFVSLDECEATQDKWILIKLIVMWSSLFTKCAREQHRCYYIRPGPKHSNCCFDKFRHLWNMYSASGIPSGMTFVLVFMQFAVGFLVIWINTYGGKLLLYYKSFLTFRV
jgi:hypothetical protein